MRASCNQRSSRDSPSDTQLAEERGLASPATAPVATKSSVASTFHCTTLTLAHSNDYIPRPRLFKTLCCCTQGQHVWDAVGHVQELPHVRGAHVCGRVSGVPVSGVCRHDSIGCPRERARPKFGGREVGRRVSRRPPHAPLGRDSLAGQWQGDPWLRRDARRLCRRRQAARAAEADSMLSSP